MINKSEELVMENQNLLRHRVDKNQLLLVSVINVVMVCCFIFSMLYYQWIEIDFSHLQRGNISNNIDDTVSTDTIKIWINLLYT